MNIKNIFRFLFLMAAIIGIMSFIFLFPNLFVFIVLLFAIAFLAWMIGLALKWWEIKF